MRPTVYLQLFALVQPAKAPGYRYVSRALAEELRKSNALIDSDTGARLQGVQNKMLPQPKDINRFPKVCSALMLFLKSAAGSAELMVLGALHTPLKRQVRCLDFCWGSSDAASSLGCIGWALLSKTQPGVVDCHL